MREREKKSFSPYDHLVNRVIWLLEVIGLSTTLDFSGSNNLYVI